jgi:hypothetical protein
VCSSDLADRLKVHRRDGTRYRQTIPSLISNPA